MAQISENIYMQYFLGYSSFSNEPPFDDSLLTDFRKCLGIDQINAINERIVLLNAEFDSQKEQESPHDKPEDEDDDFCAGNKARLIMDATACPQDIAYPTDLDLLSDARKISEQIIDTLYDIDIHKQKPRTYRQIARKRYLYAAQKKNKSLPSPLADHRQCQIT